MKRGHIRFFVGICVLLTHIASFAIIWMFKTAWTSPEERYDTALLLLPITAVYFAAVIRSAVEDKNTLDLGPPVNSFYVTVVLIVTLSTSAALLYTLLDYKSPMVPDIRSLRQSIAIFEIAFGSGFGIIAADLFGKIERVIIPDTQAPIKPASQHQTHVNQ